ncbi:hypothetical protein GGS20DRAFT_394440 [Poronia punctata]|nr:hypothetical protein GGS20DRAFT_394440 [Poronia punctata]
MAGKRTKVPDAWDDDDWESKADRAAVEAPKTEDEEPKIPMSKAERLALHAESNRKLWESAQAPPEPFHFLAARPEPPLATEFKPAVKVLSRKPTPKTITKRDPLTGAVSQLRLDDEESDEEKNKVQLTPEEVRAKQQREREEKQRRYEEVRAKIFGTNPAASGSGNASNTSSGTSTPGNATPPRSTDGRGRGRGRGRGGGGAHRHHDNRPDASSNHRPSSSQSGRGSRELFDPNYLPRPGSYTERRGGGAPITGRSTPRDEEQAIRSPKGPDGSTKGFAKRGAKAV